MNGFAPAALTLLRFVSTPNAVIESKMNSGLYFAPNFAVWGTIAVELMQLVSTNAIANQGKLLLPPVTLLATDPLFTKRAKRSKYGPSSITRVSFVITATDSMVLSFIICPAAFTPPKS